MQKYQQSEKYKAYEQSEKRKASKRKAFAKHYHLLGGHGYRRALPELIVEQNGICNICKDPLPEDHSEIDVDHVQPASKGGSNDINNLAATCKTCNRKKKDKWDGTKKGEKPAQMGLFE